MKRARESSEGESDEEGAAAVVTTAAAPPAKCPFLDQVDRAALDFDFEKCCCVTLSPLRVYACLVCGRYFQGRAALTPAHAHSLEAGHHVFMRLADGAVFCLPDGYAVQERSLDDIRAVLRPVFSPAEVARLDAPPAVWARGLDGAEFLPGCVGLNNLGASDYVAVVLQLLQRAPPLRDALLMRPPPVPGRPGGAGALVGALAELVRKLWNPRAFKGHVSPHELLQAVGAASARRFRAERRGDPVELTAWLLGSLHRELGGGGDASPVAAAFRGRLRAVTTRPGGGAEASDLPFFMLGVELPPPPLFADAMEKNLLPQVPLAACLAARYDGVTPHSCGGGATRTLRVEALPPFLLLHAKRFTSTALGSSEKNPTLLTFPLRGLRLAEALPLPPSEAGRAVYDLVASVTHEGPPLPGGAFRAQVRCAADGQWYEAADLRVGEVLPQQVAISEAYLQLWCRRDAAGPG